MGFCAAAPGATETSGQMWPSLTPVPWGRPVRDPVSHCCGPGEGDKDLDGDLGASRGTVGQLQTPEGRDGG